MIKRWLVVLILILGLMSPAFGGGATVKGQVKNHSNAVVSANKFAACFDGSASLTLSGISGTLSPDSPNGPNVGGRLYTNAGGYMSTSPTGGNDFFDPRSNQSVTIFACEEQDVSTLLANKTYYGYGSYSLGLETAIPTEPTANITCKYKADVPDDPTASAGGYNLSWDSNSKQYVVTFTISAQPGTDYETEGNNYYLAVVKDDGAATDWSNAKTYSGQSSSIKETDLKTPYYVAGGKYLVRAMASNIFGNGAWGDPTPFTIPAGAVLASAAQPFIFKFDLKKSESGKLIVNAISSPKSMKASALAVAIEAKAGKKVVVAIGHWAGDKSEAYIVDDKTGVSKDFDIKTGEGVQVYLSEEVKEFSISSE